MILPIFDRKRCVCRTDFKKVSFFIARFSKSVITKGRRVNFRGLPKRQERRNGAYGKITGAYRYLTGNQHRGEKPRRQADADREGSGFLFTDKDCNPLVAMHWEHRFNHMVKRYNDIYWVQMPNITPHVCRHTYCSNMAKSGMNPKTLQYLMGHSDIGVTLNTYTHLGLEDATDELRRMEDLENARKELEKNKEEKPISQKMFRAI